MNATCGVLKLRQILEVFAVYGITGLELYPGELAEPVFQNKINSRACLG